MSLLPRRLPSFLLLGGLLLTTMASPCPVAACSCGPGPSLAEVLESDTVAVVDGVVARDRGDGTFDFSVAAWYGGRDTRPVIVLRSALTLDAGGAVSVNTCGIEFAPGQALVFVMSPDPDGTYFPTICGMYAPRGSPQAAQLLAEAKHIRGPGVPPTDTEPMAEAEADPPRALSALALVAALVAAGAVLVTVIAVARRGHTRA